MNKISLFLIEPIGYPNKEDSNALVTESVERGYKTYCFRKEGIFIKKDKVFAKAFQVFLSDKSELYEEKESEIIELDDSTIINIRINPPFDSSYISCLYILKLAQENGAKVFNDPEGILNSPEKFIPKSLIKYTPKTLITSDYDEIISFWKENKEVIIKPLYEFAGRGIFKLSTEEENYKTILQFLKEKYNEPLVVQEYLPEVKEGDKRIIILDYEYLGCFNRVPPKGQIQAANAQGGVSEKSELTEDEEKIVSELIPILKERKILLCGLDTIGGKLTEINTTCPAYSGFNALYNTKIQENYWDKIEKYI
jgi:glutathione synthase